MQRLAVAERRLERVQDLGTDVFDQFFLENSEWFCHAHSWGLFAGFWACQLQNYSREALLAIRPSVQDQGNQPVTYPRTSGYAQEVHVRVVVGGRLFGRKAEDAQLPPGRC